MVYEGQTPNEELGKQIGSRIKFALGILKLPLVKASEILEVSVPTLSRYVAGNTLPQVDFLITLYERFKVNPLYILFGLEPIIIESLSFPSEKPKGDPSLTPFVQKFLNHIRGILKLLGDLQLYIHSKLDLSFKEFLELLSGNFPVNIETLQTLSCSFCADINAIFEEAVYRPFIIQVGTFGWDRKFEERKRNCPTEVDVLVIDIANTSHFYIWCMHGDYGGFILKVLYSYDDLDGLFWLLSKNLRAYISIDFSKDFEKQHPHITLTSQENYFYGNLMQGLGYLKDISSDHPAIKVLQRFIFLLQENL
ncbi:MAG: helix-turn-helix transcriptional regulator [Ignisphaera sp.]